MKKSLIKLSFIVAVVTAGCNDGGPEGEPGQAVSETETQVAPGGATGDPAVVHHPDTPPRPAEKQDSMQMEGTWQKFNAKLVQPTTDMPFSTYVPDDMIFEMQSSGEGQGFYFFANFAGKRNDQAFALLFLLPAGATLDDAQRFANAFTSSRSQDRTQIAHTRIGSHQNRFFYWAESYPREYSEGLGPRAGFIRRQWVWLSDGKGLEATLQPQT